MVTTQPFYLSESETGELNRLAYDFCYCAVRFSELWDKLPSNEAIDEYADELRREVREFVSRKIDERIGQLEVAEQ